MKCSVVCILFFCTSVIAQGDIFNMLYQANEQCQAETGIPSNVITTLLTGQGSPTDPSVKKQLFCIHKHVGIQDEKGNIQKKQVMQLGQALAPFVDKKIVEDIVNTCAVQKSTPEDTALEMDMCVYNSRSKIMG